jgi:hypothetical protein
MPQDKLQDLLDKQAIYEVALKYCRGLDRMDFELVRSCYHPDGIDHHTGFSGPRDEWVAHVAKIVRQFDGTQHIIANHLVELHGDVAYAETYGTAHHWAVPLDDPKCNFYCGFRSIDRLERRNGEWRIAERHSIREWTRRTRPEDILERESFGTASLRDKTDVSYLRREPAGGPTRGS